ncbi:MAG: glycoside hydrolase family 3 protein [Huintestinicola sp.]|uniref:glycoside hydrolase family 3 protein n=1 Tax=Huintestinicola sp. TaxID=2981661 RepID=UPI003EFEEA0F
MKKTSPVPLLLAALSMTACADSTEEQVYTETAAQTSSENITGTAAETSGGAQSAEDMVSALTLEQKAAQMVQPAVYSVTEEDMKKYCYGSILSKYRSVSYKEWQDIVDGFQESALSSEAGIPYLYGQDDVHGVNYCADAVYFPHNIGIGAANDPELTYQMGLATADEAKLCHMLWNFAPCVAQSADPRWGRTYESYGSDIDMIKSLGASYTKGLVDGGVIACAKHFFGDGNVLYGTGENSDVQRLMDRGDAVLSENEISALLSVYEAQIEAGVQTIMISHSSVNGVKMHENGEYIWRLKNEMGFEGFIVSDWNSVQNTSPATYEQQVITAVNSGIDMLMEVDRFEEARQIIIKAVENGDISEERVNDAVTRIIRVKQGAGIFEDPMCESIEVKQSETGSKEYRQLAERLVEKSLVLLKNEGDVLPLPEGASVYITGPAADNASAQCGGWTIDWNSSPTKNISGVTTILEGFKEKADEYGITVITDKDKASEADVVLLVTGEQAYAEWNGDTSDLMLCGQLGLSGNEAAIKEAEELNKPTVACIVAGRQVLIDEYYDKWDSVVMCYLPGSEGQGVADVLCGGTDFSGRLPSPWYSSVEQIGTDECMFEKGYGLSYN